MKAAPRRPAAPPRGLTCTCGPFAVVSKGGVYTQETEEPADYCWAQSSLVSRMIVQSVALKEALQELDWWGEALGLALSSNPPNLRLTSRGHHGTCEIDFPASSEAVDEFSCSRDSAATYRFTLVQTVFKALALSEKACLRVNEAGMLSMQLMIRDETSVTTFVEVSPAASCPTPPSRRAASGSLALRGTGAGAGGRAGRGRHVSGHGAVARHCPHRVRVALRRSRLALRAQLSCSGLCTNKHSGSVSRQRARPLGQQRL